MNHSEHIKSINDLDFSHIKIYIPSLHMLLLLACSLAGQSLLTVFASMRIIFKNIFIFK